MKWKTISKSESEKVMESWNSDQSMPFDSEYEFLRIELFKAAEEVLQELNIQNYEIKSAGYDFDLLFGLKLYEILNRNFGFTIRLASDNGVWRFLSLKVVPDLVYLRWEDNAGRYWKETRRIWLKALWWYIHLSWQGSAQETFETLKGNTTDEIVQLVERSGPSGYRIDLCREIMSFYGSLDTEQKKRSSQVFRRVMKLNTARIKVIEPGLFIGGEENYVKGLFNYFEQ